MKQIQFILTLLLAAVVLAACGGAAQSGAATAVESYLAALVTKDADKLSTLSCAAWETQAILEMDSFEAVAPQLEGVACQESGKDGDFTLVDCQGKIITTYDGEQTELELDRWTYELVQQDGNWLVCGYR